MNKQEAKEIIKKQVEAYREKPYSELTRMIGAEPVTSDFRGSSGTSYQVEIQALWDNKPNGNVRVMGSIDDGRQRAFVPLSDDFIKSPKDEFVGE